MNKEQLQTKVNTLQENVEAKHVELTNAQNELSKARRELVDAGKPILPSKVADDLVDALQDVFTQIVHNISTCDLDVEFGMDYGNQVTLEHIDFSNIGISESDIYEVLQVMFNIVDEDFVNEDDSGKVDGKFV